MSRHRGRTLREQGNIEVASPYSWKTEKDGNFMAQGGLSWLADFVHQSEIINHLVISSSFKGYSCCHSDNDKLSTGLILLLSRLLQQSYLSDIDGRASRIYLVAHAIWWLQILIMLTGRLLKFIHKHIINNVNHIRVYLTELNT
jgi:hypothetical protein